MTTPKTLILVLATLFFVTVFSNGCTKNSTPAPPVHDTVTVIKNDTTILIRNDTAYIIKNDTLYVPQTDSTVNLTKGLLLYLNFTGNIADSSGNNNPTQAVGNVLTYDTHGYANNAFGADGGGEEVLVTNNGTIQFDTAYSLSFAFMVNNTNPQTYISMVNYSTGEGPSFTTGTTLPGVPNFLFGSEDETLGCSNLGGNNNIDVVDTTGLIPVPGAWYKAICIYHRGTNMVYINGQLISSKVGLGTLSNLCPSSQIIIGNWVNGGQGMDGKLDNIRLYNRVLTPHEIILLSANYQVISNSQHPAAKTAWSTRP
jgi:Concanavalin A-like lectin/glucanases superfamily